MRDRYKHGNERQSLLPRANRSSRFSRNLTNDDTIERNATIWYREIEELKTFFLGRGGFPTQAQLPRLVHLQHRYNHVDTSLL